MSIPLRNTALSAGTQRRRLAQFRKHWQLYVLLFLPLLYLAVFQYWPIYGVQIAFRNFNAADGITGSPWVGLRHFERFISTYDFVRTLRNTVVLNLYSIAVGFPLPIMLALGLNYVSRHWFRQTVQLVSFAPYFISVVVMAGIILQFLAPNTGLVNQTLQRIGLPQVNFMGRPELFPHVYVWSGIWQTIGFSAVLYIAALTSVDPTLHEAAIVDGASKLQRIWYIDLPEIMPIALLLLILSVGGLLSTGFEKIFLLQNSLNLQTSEVIDTYVYRVGLISAFPDYSYAAAIGLFKSVVGLILLLLVDRIAKRLGQPGAL